MASLRLLLESLPLVAALVALLLVGKALVMARDKRVQQLCLMALCCTFLMMAAQASWAWTMFIKNDVLGTGFADVLWTLFNTGTMLTFAYAAYRSEQ